MVYLPDGTKLEAHSGLGDKLDDPSSAKIRMRGVTPPHIYELKPREALFHGVPALRLTPIGGEEAIYGRSGLLAHSFMLGPNGDSNGCVSFRDYNAFLNAYRNQGIKKLAVVARIDCGAGIRAARQGFTVFRNCISVSIAALSCGRSCMRARYVTSDGHSAMSTPPRPSNSSDQVR
jgi:hypothetical protein